MQEATGDARLSARGVGFGIPSWQVDGRTRSRSTSRCSEACEHMRSGGGPTVVEVETYRYFHQNGPFPGSAFGYRSKDEEASWRDRDPIAKVEHHLQRRGLYIAEDVAGVRKSIKAAHGGDRCGPGRAGPERQAGPAAHPTRAVAGPRVPRRGHPRRPVGPGGRHGREAEDFAPDELEQRRMVDVVADTMARRMELDPSIVVMGEDVHRLNGGSRGATKGLKEKFDDRVLGTPISECAFTGLGGGLAQDGRFYPVVELMYADFIWVAADQIFNQIGKARHMFGGDHDMPLLMRIKIGTGTGYGSQHSMDPAGILATSVGWRIIAPSTPLDYVGLVNAAMRLKDPVAVLEHDADLYRFTGDAPKDDYDFILPPGEAAVRREGIGRHGADLHVHGAQVPRRPPRRPGWTPRSSTCAGWTGRAWTGTRSRRASRRPTRC